MSSRSRQGSDSMGFLTVNGRPTIQTGFTLLEMMIVLAIIALLLTISAPRYFQHLDRAKENALKQTLFIVRDAIDKYQTDKGRFPESLDQLVADHYLRQRPFDPITERSDTWVVRTNEYGGIEDLHSSAPGKAIDESLYSDW